MPGAQSQLAALSSLRSRCTDWATALVAVTFGAAALGKLFGYRAAVRAVGTVVPRLARPAPALVAGLLALGGSRCWCALKRCGSV